MATTNVGKPFGVVTSKNQATAIIESKQDANSGQFYITRTDNSNTGGVGNTEGDASQAISLTINGNVLRGISKDDAIKLANLNIGSGTIAEGAFNYKGSVGDVDDLPIDAKVGDVYNISNDFYLDGTMFPAYTSVVYVDDGTYTWMSLGGNFDIRVNNDDCLYVADYAIGIKLGPGLSTNHGEYLTPRLGPGLSINSEDDITPSLGPGLSTNYDGYIIPNLGPGLIIRDDYITPNLGTGFCDDAGSICVNIDNITIGVNTDSKLRVKHDSTLSESVNGLSVKVGHGLVTGGDGININLASPISDLQQLPVSTAGILVNDGTNGLCVDIPALKRLVELIMAAK